MGRKKRIKVKITKCWREGGHRDRSQIEQRKRKQCLANVFPTPARIGYMQREIAGIRKRKTSILLRNLLGITRNLRVWNNATPGERLLFFVSTV
jgi:hypothetical protein